MQEILPEVESERQIRPYTFESNILLHTVTAAFAPERLPCGTRVKLLNAAWFPT